MGEKKNIFEWCKTCETVPDRKLVEERAIWCKECLRETITSMVGNISEPVAHRRK